MFYCFIAFVYHMINDTLFSLKVFCNWRELATTMRQKVFDDDMEEEINVFDLKV